MGTRNLTMVISNKETKIAQYGQWDGYPEGQGKTALNFLKNTNLDAFRTRLQTVRFMTDEDRQEREAFLKSLGSDGRWVNMEQSNKYDARYPLDSRDNGAEILQMTMDSGAEEIVLDNSETFAADSLFCEWAYVIDLDKGTFEVYEGFNQQPLTEQDRFFYLQERIKDREDKYYPVKLAHSFDLSSLPDSDGFIAAFAEKEEAED